MKLILIKRAENIKRGRLKKHFKISNSMGKNYFKIQQKIVPMILKPRVKSIVSIINPSFSNTESKLVLIQGTMDTIIYNRREWPPQIWFQDRKNMKIIMPDPTHRLLHHIYTGINLFFLITRVGRIFKIQGLDQ